MEPSGRDLVVLLGLVLGSALILLLAIWGLLALVVVLFF